ncbi:glutathione S-transferase [Litoreibacter ascidiaceicola]|uniref:Glutathione S-transferase n=1 Tax=Litoreibacter ascidiaceicola TaxID=1486859 RepID=A0A1M5CZK7_9RHOB|nr:glutathione S-transferase family protein [Litoreibacter ascidiaceicola]SHF60168.1 glutathione S-transferase [Litoreibacter ascidiaceicola]
MYTLIGLTKTRTFRVKWALEELGLPYTQLQAAPRSEEAIEYNPSGKVPALIADGATLTDSTAIITFLADKHNGLTLKAGSLGRARQDGFTHMILDEFDSVLWTAARHSFILPEEKRVPEVKESLKWEFARSETTLVAQMGDGPFLMGDEFTIADIILAHCLDWAIGAKFGISQSRLKDYLSNVHTRPAYKTARAD